MTRVRGRVFGEVADDYDRIRPDYPDQLVDDVLAAAGPGPVLEVGAGTGKATVAFAARGADLTCIEPDPRMAEVLRRKLPEVPIVETTLEEWTPDRAYGLLVSGQAWHWVDETRGSALAFGALAPGGLFAPFWNGFLVTDPAVHAELQKVDARHGITDHTWHRLLAADFPGLGAFDDEWARLRLDPAQFPDRTHRRYRSTVTYAAGDYRALLLSTSTYRIMSPAAADAAAGDAVAVIAAHGGEITFEKVTDVALARRA